jgi:hypothetical protein
LQFLCALVLVLAILLVNLVGVVIIVKNILLLLPLFALLIPLGFTKFVGLLLVEGKKRGSPQATRFSTWFHTSEGWQLIRNSKPLNG